LKTKVSDRQIKITVGRKEWCGFPDLMIPAIKSRVDSGAKTSSIHAFNIIEFDRQDIAWVSFEVHPLQKDNKTQIRCESPIIDKRNIKSSNGKKERRIVIRTSLQLGESNWEIDLSLTNRDAMGYRMLLGREAMMHRIIVDPAKSHCLGDYSKADLELQYGVIRRLKHK
jgi:ribosomal protein S6--L-glutamate ligase